jgi:hypothetical protein
MEPIPRVFITGLNLNLTPSSSTCMNYRKDYTYSIDHILFEAKLCAGVLAHLVSCTSQCTVRLEPLFKI